MLLRSLTTKSRERLAHNVVHIFATHAGLVRNVTQIARHKMAALVTEFSCNKKQL